MPRGARAAGGGAGQLPSFVRQKGHHAHTTPINPQPPLHTPLSQQDLYVAVVKATIEEETVPKEKHVRS
jgi:hypothetical protein